jgi:hypothetical protein
VLHSVSVSNNDRNKDPNKDPNKGHNSPLNNHSHAIKVRVVLETEIISLATEETILPVNKINLPVLS